MAPSALKGCQARPQVTPLSFEALSWGQTEDRALCMVNYGQLTFSPRKLSVSSPGHQFSISVWGGREDIYTGMRSSPRQH